MKRGKLRGRGLRCLNPLWCGRAGKECKERQAESDRGRTEGAMLGAANKSDALQRCTGQGVGGRAVRTCAVCFWTGAVGVERMGRKGVKV
ncbi:hypothetical protein EJ04DRAFT_103066 [Polyplosphaeria fusca]|uniref:Uncharacterized protein n=1 Tax=Polyplosphaeria fusca TaxID=682080 RepID=A0A9P4V5T0_9PLEO|nr:hypothetical protein EJ04DRAFT_103066 [Polyplosphaeria fusca]